MQKTSGLFATGVGVVCKLITFNIFLLDPIFLRVMASEGINVALLSCVFIKILVPRSWYQDPGTKILARRGTEIFGTARIIRARHGNIWHGTDPPDLGTARHGTSLEECS